MLRKRYRVEKVFRDHADPETGLHWMGWDYVKVPCGYRINWFRAVDLMMKAWEILFIGLWIYWFVSVALPAIL